MLWWGFLPWGYGAFRWSFQGLMTELFALCNVRCIPRWRSDLPIIALRFRFMTDK